MSMINRFTTWEEVETYITDTMGITYTDNPTGWVEAMKELTKGYKYVKVVNDVTGETSYQFMQEDMVSGVGEFHVGENTSGASASVTGSGVKSAPTAKSIITDNTSHVAVLEDEATGVKDTGLINGVKAINILNGLLQVYGLIHTGIKIANAQVWKDMSNYVYATDFDEDTPVERVIDFLRMKIVNTITDITSDGDLVVNVPDTIAQRMYDFLANHMIMQEVPGVTPEVGGFNLIYNFYERTIALLDPSTYTLERYRSVHNPTDVIRLPIISFSDDLIKACAADFIQQCIGSGFLIAASVATALLASIDGIHQFLKDQSVDAVDNAELAHVEISMYRGSTPPSKDTPVSLSEFKLIIYAIQDESIPIHEYDDKKNVDCNLNIPISGESSGVWWPALEPGYSYQNGDCMKYLKRGYDGTKDSDFGYGVRISDKTSTTGKTCRAWRCTATYPSNEQLLTYYNYREYTQETFCVNGMTGGVTSLSTTFNGSYVDNRESVPNDGMVRYYSNIGYLGSAVSYQPDDYLVTAGIRSKIDSSGNPEKHPNPNKTKEEVYPGMSNKKQQANPQAVTDPQTGTTTINNNITNYVPATIPFGSENANRTIEHGLNNPDDPDSYVDNRPQEDKENGYVNKNDPVDGYNEDTDTAVNEYNDSENDPQHYPEPIPKNEPNPQYPDNPPTEPGGETEDPPTPGTMEGVEASGMVSVYNPTKQQVIDFSAWLWSPNFLDNFLKLFENPMDGIIGLHILYATPHTGGNDTIRVGYLNSNVSSAVVDQQFIEVDCQSVTIPEYYGNAVDYEPYVQIHVYLPFVGVVSVKPNDVIGKQLHVKYGVDVLTGTCLAMLFAKDKTSEMLLYTFSGNCAVQVPLSGGNYAQVISGLATMAIGVGAGIATGNPIAAVGGVAAGVMSSHLDVSHSGSIGANAGAMGPRKPHVIITRKSAYEAANYGQFYGYPANKTVVLGSCSGFTRIKSVHIDSIYNATDNEKTEIEALLKQGVIIK